MGLTALVLGSCAAPMPSSIGPSGRPGASRPPAPSSGAESPDSAESSIAWVEGGLAGEVIALGTDGDQFVAVGRAENAQAAWTSGDGISWQLDRPIAVPTDLLPRESSLAAEVAGLVADMGVLVRLDETLFSFGLFSFNDVTQPVGWRRSGLGSWEPIASSSEFYSDGVVTHVAAGDRMLVAAKSGESPAVLGATSEIWTWTPDASWVRADPLPSRLNPAVVTGLTSFGGGYVAAGYVAAGFTPPGGEAPFLPPMMWESRDGRAWTEIEPPDRDGEVCALESAPTGEVMAVSGGAGGATAWTRRDGTWEGEPLPGSAGITHSGMTCHLVPLTSGSVAVLNTGDAAWAWHSLDGAGWSEAGAVGAPIDFAAGIGDTLVLADVRHRPDRSQISTVLRVGRVGSGG